MEDVLNELAKTMKKNLTYIMSVRNSAADKAGEMVAYKGDRKYMKSPLEYLIDRLEHGALGEYYDLKAIIYDDDFGNNRDAEFLNGYDFDDLKGRHWIFPSDLKYKDRYVRSMMSRLPSEYRRMPLASSDRPEGKSLFEVKLREKLIEVEAEVVVLDGLLVILDELIRPGALFHKKIFNIHPGITREHSPYQRRGAYATLDALYGARGEKVIDWVTMEKVKVQPVKKTGASFHYVDRGIDSGPVVVDVLDTDIYEDDTIIELRWRNFNKSLFPALEQGLLKVATQSASSN